MCLFEPFLQNKYVSSHNFFDDFQLLKYQFVWVALASPKRKCYHRSIHLFDNRNTCQFNHQTLTSNICNPPPKLLYHIFHQPVTPQYFSLIDISHNLVILHFYRGWIMQHGLLIPIPNYVNWYNYCPTPQM